MVSKGKGRADSPDVLLGDDRRVVLAAVPLADRAGRLDGLVAVDERVPLEGSVDALAVVIQARDCLDIGDVDVAEGVVLCLGHRTTLSELEREVEAAVGSLHADERVALALVEFDLDIGSAEFAEQADDVEFNECLVGLRVLRTLGCEFGLECVGDSQKEVGLQIFHDTEILRIKQFGLTTPGAPSPVNH